MIYFNYKKKGNKLVKKIFSRFCYITTTILVLAFFFFSMLTLANLQKVAHVRTERLRIIEADENNYAAIGLDGNIWEFSDRKNFFVGEVVTAKFDTKGTDSIYDDEITFVK